MIRVCFALMFLALTSPARAGPVELSYTRAIGVEQGLTWAQNCYPLARDKPKTIGTCIADLLFAAQTDVDKARAALERSRRNHLPVLLSPIRELQND